MCDGAATNVLTQAPIFRMCSYMNELPNFDSITLPAIEISRLLWVCCIILHFLTYQLVVQSFIYTDIYYIFITCFFYFLFFFCYKWKLTTKLCYYDQNAIFLSKNKNHYILSALILYSRKPIWNPKIISLQHMFFRYNLETHSVTHSGAKNHKCVICQKRFSTKSSLKNHTAIHSEERLFQCEICAKTFKTNRRLYVHKFSHATEEKYQCEICLQKFR